MGEIADEFLMQEGLLFTKPKYGTVFVFYEPQGGIADRVAVSFRLISYNSIYLLDNFMYNISTLTRLLLILSRSIEPLRH